jgi:hypothetical protein
MGEIRKYIYKYKKIFLACILFCVWQTVFLFSRPQKPEVTPYHSCSLGLCGFYEIYREASAFFYHSGIFPILALNSLEENLDKNSVENYLSGEGSLLNDKKYATRMGEVGKVLLFFPSIFFGSSETLPTVKPVLIGAFWLGSIFFLIAMFAHGELQLGVLILLLLGSSPHLIYENYSNVNLFGFSVSVLLISMSLGLLLAYFTKSRIQNSSANGFGALVCLTLMVMVSAFTKEIRSEVFYCSMAGILALFLYNPFRKTTFILSLVFFLSLWGLNKGFEQYWNYKFKQAQEYVASRGKGFPVPSDVPRPRAHEVWHNILTGFGDFDEKYGYRWDDRVIYKWTLEQLNQLTNRNFKSVDYYINDEFWDKDKMYPVRSCDFPEYQIVTKEVLKRQIMEDPKWYIEILGKRIIAVFTKIGDVHFSIGRWSVILARSYVASVLGLFCLVVFLLVKLFVKPQYLVGSPKSKIVLTVAICPLIIAAPSIVVTTAHGASYINYYQYFWFGFACYFIFGFLGRALLKLYERKFQQ